MKAETGNHEDHLPYGATAGSPFAVVLPAVGWPGGGEGSGSDGTRWPVSESHLSTHRGGFSGVRLFLLGGWW